MSHWKPQADEDETRPPSPFRHTHPSSISGRKVERVASRLQPRAPRLLQKAAPSIAHPNNSGGGKKKFRQFRNASAAWRSKASIVHPQNNLRDLQNLQWGEQMGSPPRISATRAREHSNIGKRLAVMGCVGRPGCNAEAAPVMLPSRSPDDTYRGGCPAPGEQKSCRLDKIPKPRKKSPKEKPA